MNARVAAGWHALRPGVASGPIETIVIGYDGRERGGEATALAEVLRDPYQGRLLLTSAYPQDPRLVGGFGVSDEIDELGDAIDELGDATEAMLAEARGALPDPAHAQIRAVPSDSPARALSEVAEAEHADLIVVGSSRRSALGRPLPGTTAERLLQDAPCTVAVAPRGYSGRDIRRIGVATTARARRTPPCARQSCSRSSSALA